MIRRVLQSHRLKQTTTPTRYLCRPSRNNGPSRDNPIYVTMATRVPPIRFISFCFDWIFSNVSHIDILLFIGYFFLFDKFFIVIVFYDWPLYFFGQTVNLLLCCFIILKWLFQMDSKHKFSYSRLEIMFFLLCNI